MYACIYFFEIRLENETSFTLFWHKFYGVTKNSKTRSFASRPISNKFVTQSITTFSTTDLKNITISYFGNKVWFFLIKNGKNNFREQLSPLPLSTDGIILLVMDAGTQKLSFRHPKTFPEMMASWTRIFFSLFLPNFWCTCSILKIILNMANIWQKMKKIFVQHIIFNPLFYGSSKTQVLGTQIHHYKILYMYI